MPVSGLASISIRARTVRLCAVLLVACCALLPSTARADVTTFGSDLSRPANLPFGCEARPYPGLGGMQLLATGVTSCMWWSAPLTPTATYVPRGEGRIVGARVRSGANPAPLRISVVSSGGGLCCTSRSTSAVFQPRANDVTAVALDLPAGSGVDPNRPGSQYNDIVVVSAVGPGSLPVHDFGVHNTLNPNAPAATFLHPELTGGNSNTDVGWMDGYEVLLQVDWCGTPGVAGRARAAQATCPAPAPPATPQPQPAPTPTPAPAPTPATRRLSGLALAGRTLRVTTPVAGRVSARFERCVRKPRRTVCRTVARLSKRAASAGTVRLALPRGLRAGRYRVTVSARGAATLVRQLTVSAATPRRGR